MAQLNQVQRCRKKQQDLVKRFILFFVL